MVATEAIVFSKHVRSRSSALINLLPFPHHYQNVLSAIAHIDWQVEQGVDTTDARVYLEFAGIDSDKTAIEYLDWLEPKMRRHLSRYEQMLAVHRQELRQLVREFA